jgi:hypothetical protein
MNQPTLLELANQADENAINSLMNYRLQDKCIIAQST